VNETSKAMRRRFSAIRSSRSRYFVGRGIDIGSGPDPLIHQVPLRAWPMMDCDEWDVEDGDAQLMEGVDDETFDLRLLVAHASSTLSTPTSRRSRTGGGS
jgi:hypothetical protein